MEGGIIFVLDHITPLQLFSDAFKFKKIYVNFLLLVPPENCVLLLIEGSRGSLYSLLLSL